MFAAINSFLTRALTNLTDVYWPFVSMLLHGDSPQQFNQDTSTNVFPITANGAVQASTRTPFTGGPSSYGSGYFSGGYLTVPNNAAFTLGTNDFTIEYWAYFTSLVGGRITSSQSDSAFSLLSFFTAVTATGALDNGILSTTAGLKQPTSSAGSVVINTWTHIAFVRNGNTLRAYVNGVQNGTISVTGLTVQPSTEAIGIGATPYGQSPTAGYISNFRLVNGTCLYPSGTTFTPPTTQLTAVTNTALLTLQTNVPQNNNQFFDTSTNNFTVTRNGNTTQGSFNPFVKTYPYAVATNGGSAYFNGTSGNSVTAPANAAFNLGTNNFTIECWINLSSLTANPMVAMQLDSAFSVWSFYIYVQNNGTLNFAVQNASGALVAPSSSAFAIVVNTWYHIACVRDGNTARMYINGTQVGTGNTTGFTVRSSTDVLGVGGGAYTGNPTTGYISNFRLVNGTCLYPSGTTFTPPTAPLTAVTNTALLLGMSNGAIYDNTMLNNLETVASAQISTSTFKYGTGALKFGGTSTDYMPTRKTSAFVLGSGDFTIECWVNFASGTASGYFAGDYDGTANFNFYMWANAGVMTSTFDSGGNRNCTSSAGAIVVNTWYHIAFVRDGNTNRQYINGVQNGTVSVTGLAADGNASPLAIGAAGSAPTAPYFNGYIDDFRFTKGICRYPSGTTFTPPTAAFPNLGPTYPSGTATQRAIFGYGTTGAYVSVTNIVSNTGVVAGDTTGVGTARAGLAAASYGGDKALFGYGTNGTSFSLTNRVSNTGVVAADTTGVGTARIGLAAAGYGTDKAIFGYGGTPPTVLSMTNLVSNTGVVSGDTAGVGTARAYIAATGYGTDKAIFACGTTSFATNADVSLTNLVSNTGVVATDTTGVGTAREELAAARYGGDKAIYGYGNISTGALVSMTNLISNTGVVSADVTGVGTARRGPAASNYGGDKAIFGYGLADPTYLSLTNLVSNTGVVATDTTGVGTGRFFSAAAGFSYS